MCLFDCVKHFALVSSILLQLQQHLFSCIGYTKCVILILPIYHQVTEYKTIFNLFKV